MRETLRPDAVGAKLGQQFISYAPVLSETDSGAYVAFRKSFDLARVPAKAELSLFADAHYVLWINGKYVNRGPSRFEPTAPEYDAISVASFLRPGRNVISILVVGRLSNGKTYWRPIGLTAQLTAGKRLITQTDPTWRWSREIRYQKALVDWANIYDVADARVEDGDWTRADYDDARWQFAHPVAQSPQPLQTRTLVDNQDVNLSVRPVGDSWWGPLTRSRIPQLREVAVHPEWAQPILGTVSAGESRSFKFRNLKLATTTIEVDAEAGSEIRFSYLPQTRYICRGGRQTFTTSDSHSIFDGSISVVKGKVTFHAVEFHERLYPFHRLGSFDSNDALLNQLWTTCVRGLEIVSEDAYVDCTDRERVEWFDVDPPSFDVTRVAMAGLDAKGHWVYSDPRLLEVMLRRTALSIQPEGWVKAHTSSDRFDIHAKMEDRSCNWVQGARRYYESTGKTGVIREIWPAIVRQMDYFLAHRTERGLVEGREWTVWGNPLGYRVCEATTLNAFVARAFLDAAYLGRKIGKGAEAAKLEAHGKELAAAINAELWDEKTGSYYAGYTRTDQGNLALKVQNHLIEPTRHAALFMLDQDLVPKDRHARTLAYLLAHPPRENDIMQYYYYWKQLYRLDRPEADQDVLTVMRREWQDMAGSPYEATFEGLHSWGSQAHGYGMFPAYFLSSYVLGVRREGKQIVIEPRLGDLERASGTVVTELGPVRVSWHQQGNAGRFMLDLPEGVPAVVRLPGDFARLEGHTFKTRGRWVETTVVGGHHSGAWGKR